MITHERVQGGILSTGRILLVKDNDDDAEIVVRGFAAQKIVNTVERAHDGNEALALMRTAVREGQLPVVLLDLKMPGMDGFEFLEEVRRDPDLRRALIFVLTASEDEEDKSRSFDYNVAGYIVKDRAGAGFIEVFRLFERYWEVVERPAGLALEFKA